MTSITLYHNPRCSKSREALALLEQHGVEPDLRLYIDTPPTVPELRKLLRALALGPRDLLRTGETAYAERKLADPALSDTALLEAMAAEPRLIQRPIAVSGKHAVLGRPPEKVLELLR